ncbi:MAG: hypothetical protein NC930_06175 [Candidatus Omnitrophica bacterium]|nr:hypothetical protein [Candidatus Omnitrophota bacterium]
MFQWQKVEKLAQPVTFIYRVDGGKHLGGGHILKAKILIDECRRRRLPFRFVVVIKEDALGIRHARRIHLPLRVMPDRLPRNKEPDWMIRQFPDLPRSVMVLDILDVGRAYVRRLRRAGARVITLENNGTSQNDAHVTVNALVSGIRNRKVITRGGRFLSGANYRVFHPDYSGSVRDQRIRRQVKKILISLGAGDVGNRAAQIAELLAARYPQTRVTCVLGPLQERRLKSSRPTVRYINSPPSLARLFRQADVAVLGGGGTLYEAALMGVPVISLALKPHQVRNIRFFQKAGTSLTAGLLNGRGIRRAVQLAGFLMKQYGLRDRMRRKGLLLCDGRGLERMVDLFQSEAKHVLANKKFNQ